MTQRLAAHLLFRLRISPWLRQRALSRGAFVLMFHGTPKAIPAHLPERAKPALDRARFTAVLGWLAQEHIPVLTPDKFLAGNRGVLLTFDDGFANNVEQALPELECHGFPALFFATTQHVDDPGDWLPSVRVALSGVDLDGFDRASLHDLFDGASVEQIGALADHPLITVGSHTVSHPFLTRCNDPALADELIVSKARLESLWGQPVLWFAYPTGDYDRRVAQAVLDAGYRHAVVENVRGAGFPELEIPRIGIYDADQAVLEAKLSGLFRRPWWPVA